jgi:hypothetical protein
MKDTQPPRKIKTRPPPSCQTEACRVSIEKIPDERCAIPRALEALSVECAHLKPDFPNTQCPEVTSHDEHVNTLYLRVSDRVLPGDAKVYEVDLTRCQPLDMSESTKRIYL